MNGMKTYIITTIMATLAAALGSVGTIDVKTGIGGVLVSLAVFALRHGMATSVATVIATISGVIQQALSTFLPNEAAIAGIVKAAVTEALAEQAAAQMATKVSVIAAPAPTSTVTTTSAP